jgi:hypothetical protein
MKNYLVKFGFRNTKLSISLAIKTISFLTYVDLNLKEKIAVVVVVFGSHGS